MVATAGMKAAGSAKSSMKIKGTLDTGNIDRGFSRVRKGFEGVKGQAKSFGADMQRVATTVSGLAKKLLGLGIAGVTAMVGIASKAPAVAPALAKMKVEFGKLQRSLGEALAPAFERVAGWMGKLATWVGNNKEKIGEIANKFLDWAEAIGKKLWPFIEKIGNWAMEHPGLFSGIVAGLALAPSVISGIGTLTGLITMVTGAAVGSSVLTFFGYLAAIAAAGGLVLSVGPGLANQFKVGQGTPVPMTQEAKSQIATAGTGEMLDLSNRYGDRITGTGYGPETTPQIDMQTGELYSNKHQMRDIELEMQKTSFIIEEQDRRNFLLQWWDSVWS